LVTGLMATAMGLVPAVTGVGINAINLRKTP